MKIECASIIVISLYLLMIIAQDNKYNISDVKEYCCENGYTGWVDLTVWRFDGTVIYPMRTYGETEEATYCLRENLNLTELEEKIQKYTNKVKVIYTNNTC